MKVVVFGKHIYDTITAKRVYFPSIHPEGWEVEEMLRTPEGRLFLFGGGGMSGDYVIPCSFEQAVRWVLAQEDSAMNKLTAIEAIAEGNSPSQTTEVN